ncbi:MAG TPA: phosphate signaling complex protein PhoU [Verrucomicrobiae bacterium]|nr:phosphate signaling complex protein PhoU [Verrucomicrobiae bacterium]
MERHFDQELAGLKEALLRMAGLAERSVAQSLKALVQRDHELSKAVDEDDEQIDKLEIEIDDRCIKLLALRQPIATDLRFITMAMKISSELERIGDQAVNIAHRAEELNREPLLKPLVDIPRMAEHAQGMIHDSLDAFVYAKPDLARQVIARDEKVDLLNRQLHRELTSFMIEDPHTITRCLNLMSIAHNLERIGDHATNIAEDIVYLYEGRDIRHQNESAA